MSRQELQRREWGPFKGLYGNVIGSAVPHGYAQQATNCRLNFGVLEVEGGDANKYADQGVSPADYLYTYLYSMITEDFSALSSDKLISFNGVYFEDQSNSAADLYYASADASVTFTNGNTAITGSGTTWQTDGIKAGDFLKQRAGADSTYQQIATVNSNTSITLSAVWAGSSTSTTASIRITHTSTNVRNMTSASLDGYTLTSNTFDLVLANNGSSLFTVTTAPKMKTMCPHKSRMFGGGVPATPHRLFWCPVNQPEGVWDTTNAQTDIGVTDGGGGIAKVISFKNRLFVFKENNGLIYEVIGDFSTSTGTPDYVVQVVRDPAVGVVVPKTIVEHKNLIYFLSTSGLWAFDGSDLKKIHNGLDNYVYSNPTTVSSRTSYTRIFSISFGNRLYINLYDQFAILDQEDNICLQTNPASSDPYHGSFATIRDSGDWRLFVLNGGADVVKFDNYFDTSVGATRTRVKSVDNSANNITATYVCEDDYLDSPEYEKDFDKFFIVFEEVSTSAITFNFDFDINNTGSYYTATTITATGTSGRIRVAEVKVQRMNITDPQVRGRCIKWRVVNSSGVNIRIHKIILRYELFNYR